MFLDAIRARPGGLDGEGFPFDLAVLRGFEELRLTTPVTFLVGENGSGKSTVLEAIAAGVGAVAVGSAEIARDPTLAPARALAKRLVFVRRRHARTRLFFRAEDAFGFAKRLTAEMAEHEAIAGELTDSLPPGWGRQIAVGAARAQGGALAARYGADPDGFSHGEAFLRLLESRIVPRGLHLLDEPETPLSPQRVLALLVLLHRAVGTGAQFVIATHSPILMALPGARILSFDDGRIAPVAWDELPHVDITRAFLNNPEAWLSRLFAEG